MGSEKREVRDEDFEVVDEGAREGVLDEAEEAPEEERPGVLSSRLIARALGGSFEAGEADSKSIWMSSAVSSEQPVSC